MFAFAEARYMALATRHSARASRDTCPVKASLFLEVVEIHRPEARPRRTQLMNATATRLISINAPICCSACDLRVSPAGRTTRIIDPGGEDRDRYESSNSMPDLRSRMHEAKYSPEGNRQLMLRIRRSNIQLGDGRIKVILVVPDIA